MATVKPCDDHHHLDASSTGGHEMRCESKSSFVPLPAWVPLAAASLAVLLIGIDVPSMDRKGTRDGTGRMDTHTCSRGHTYEGSGPCPECWPGGARAR